MRGVLLLICLYAFQKQSLSMFYKKSCSYKFCKTLKKTPVPYSNKVAGFFKRDTGVFP